jgi:Septum formation
VSDDTPSQPFNWNLTPRKDPAEPVVPPDPPPDPPIEPAPEPPAEPAPEPLVEPPPVGARPSIPYADIPTEAYSFDPSLTGATSALGSQPVGLPEPPEESPRNESPRTELPRSESPPTSPIEALFGEVAFKEYDSGVFVTESAPAFGGTRAARVKGERQPLQRGQKVLVWIAGSLVAMLALVGLFLVGTKLSKLLAQAPVASASPSPSATALGKAVAPKVGPLPPGTYSWRALLDAECLQPYTSAWDEQYTVVDCATPHAAQVVAHGVFSDEGFAQYPGLDQLLLRVNTVCSVSTAIDYAAAKQFDDVQISASYAATAQAWDAGHRDYYCFVSRSSGEALTTSIAAPPPAAAITQGVPGNDP